MQRERYGLNQKHAIQQSIDDRPFQVSAASQAMALLMSIVVLR